MLPGPFAPTVTQWVAKPVDLWETDDHGNQVPTFTERPIRVLAEFPGGGSELNNMVTADRVLLLTPGTQVAPEDEFDLSDGLRYRVEGAVAPYRSPFTGTAVTQVNLRRIT